MTYGADQSNKLSVLDSENGSIIISSKVTVQLEYFNHAYLDNTHIHRSSDRFHMIYLYYFQSLIGVPLIQHENAIQVIQ